VRNFDGTRDRPNDERGFIHKKILGIGSKVLGVAGRVIPLPGAGILRTAGDILGGLAQPAPRRPPPQIIEHLRPPRPGISLPPALIPKGPGGLIGALPGVPGGISGFADNGCPGEPKVCAPRGTHLNKSSYFLRDGTFVPKGTRFVSNRRLNNANGRAQDKAIVRLEKGQDHAKKLLKATGWRTISKQSSREMRNAKKAVCK